MTLFDPLLLKLTGVGCALVTEMPVQELPTSHWPLASLCRYPADASLDTIIMTTGTEMGALLVDGLGDGVLVECAGQDLGTLRSLSFNLLQGSRMRNTKTGQLDDRQCILCCLRLQVRCMRNAPRQSGD